IGWSEPYRSAWPAPAPPARAGSPAKGPRPGSPSVMSHARSLRTLGGLLAVALASSGCTHNHYYTYDPCAPAATRVVPGALQYGSVCDVPTAVAGGSAVASGASTPVIGGGRPPPPGGGRPHRRPPRPPPAAPPPRRPPPPP